MAARKVWGRKEAEELGWDCTTQSAGLCQDLGLYPKAMGAIQGFQSGAMGSTGVSSSLGLQNLHFQQVPGNTDAAGSDHRLRMLSAFCK